MSWIKTNEKDVLANLMQDTLIPIHTIHDEVDMLIPDALLEPLINKVAKMGACKDVFDKIGKPFINFLADCEFDRLNHTFLPKQSFSPYTTPESEEEALALERMLQSQVKVEVMEVKADSIKDFKNKIEYTNDKSGVFVKLILPDGRSITSSRPITKDSIQRFLDNN